MFQYRVPTLLNLEYQHVASFFTRHNLEVDEVGLRPRFFMQEAFLQFTIFTRNHVINRDYNNRDNALLG